MLVSQVYLFLFVIWKELGFKIFRRTSSGTFLTRRGMEFYEKAQELVKGFDVFQNQYANPEEEKDEFSIASQHYDFCHQRLQPFQSVILIIRTFVFFESTTVQILDEVAKDIVRLGLSTSTTKIKRGSCNGLKSLV